MYTTFFVTQQPNDMVLLYMKEAQKLVEASTTTPTIIIHTNIIICRHYCTLLPSGLLHAVASCAPLAQLVLYSLWSLILATLFLSFWNFLCNPHRTHRFCTRVGPAILEYHPIDEYKLQIT